MSTPDGANRRVSKKDSRVAVLSFDPARPETLLEEPLVRPAASRREEEIVLLAERLQLLKRAPVPGTVHWLPNGVTVRELILKSVQTMMNEYGAHTFLLSRIFPAPEAGTEGAHLIQPFQDEIICAGDSDRRLIYASDPAIFQLFAGKDLTLPVRTYSPGLFYRQEPAGSVKPFTRPREFFMTDFHTFGESRSLQEFRIGAELNARALKFWLPSVQWSLSVDVTQQFLNERLDELLSILRQLGVAASINVTANRTHYYDLQFGFMVNFLGGLHTQIGNLQYDEVNGQAFSISDAATGMPVTVTHGTLSSRPERILAMLLGNAIEHASSKPMLPIWLSPIIVRLLPIGSSPQVLERIEAIKLALQQAQIRFQIDRDAESIGKRIKRAEQAWVPFIAVIGDQEARSSDLQVRVRASGRQESFTLASLIEHIKQATAGKPNEAQYVPVELQRWSV